MATYINNIFNFGRSLPSPFDTIANKKIKVSSKYGDGTTSTLCGTVIKAVHAVCHCMDGSGEGAVGIIDHRTAAEDLYSAGADAYHLVVYDSNTGSLMASVYDSNMETFENYTLNSSGRDGAAVMMALFPMLMQDDEFKENFEAYQDELNAGYPHMDKATEYMALMCDNAYRRIKDPIWGMRHCSNDYAVSQRTPEKQYFAVFSGVLCFPEQSERSNDIVMPI